MQDMSKEIWKEILPPEREVLPAAKTKRPKDAPPQADHWPLAILLERAAYLRKLAKHGDGQASETLKEYPQHATMLSFRGRNGIAELHETSLTVRRSGWPRNAGDRRHVAGARQLAQERFAAHPSRAACARNSERATWRMCRRRAASDAGAG